MPYIMTVLALLRSLSQIADHSGQISASDRDTRKIYSGSIRMDIPKEFIAPNSSRLDPHSCLIVCVWPGLNSTGEVRLGIPSRLIHGEFYMNILVQEKSDSSDPKKQFERYVAFNNKELVQSDSMFGLEYMKSLSPTVRDVFFSHNIDSFTLARCERENTHPYPSCFLFMSQSGFIIQVGLPRSELQKWKQIVTEVGKLIRSWIQE